MAAPQIPGAEIVCRALAVIPVEEVMSAVQAPGRLTAAGFRRHGCAFRLLPSRIRIRGLPLEHQDRGVVAEFVVLMLEDGMDEQA